MSKPEATTPPSAPATLINPADERRLVQFNFQHATLPATMSVTVLSTPDQARGLAYLTAEEFCTKIIGQIKGP